MVNLRPLIQAYYKDWNRISEMESYKWEALKHFKENYDKSYDSLYAKILTVFEKSGNLLASSKYLPLGMLLEFANPEYGRPDELQMLFNDLFCTEQLPTPDIVRSFIKRANAIMHEMAESGYGDWKGRSNLNSYQDAHAVSVYLSMFYPNDFYIYKYTVFKDFAKAVNISITSHNPIERLYEFQKICNEVKQELKKEKELIIFYKEWLHRQHYKDDNLNLLTQDFIYAVARHLNSESFIKIKNNKKRVDKCIQISASELEASSPHIQQTFTGIKGMDYINTAKHNSEIGFSGELWVELFERERLISIGLNPNDVRHVSYLDGDGLGYDILSIEDDGVTKRYIEVKTTSGGESQPVFFSDNEMRFSIDHREHYYLYRVYDFKAADKTANLTIVKGGLDELKAEAIVYKTRIKHL